MWKWMCSQFSMQLDCKHCATERCGHWLAVEVIVHRHRISSLVVPRSSDELSCYWYRFWQTKVWQDMTRYDVWWCCNFNAVMNSMLLVASCCLLQGLCEFSSFMNKFYFGSVQNPNVPTHECVLKWRIIAKARTRVAHFRWIWTSISSGMQNSLGLWKLLKLTPVVCFLIVSERHIDRARAAVCSYTSSCIYDYTDTIQYMDQALPPPLPPNGMGPIYCPRIKSSPPPWCGGDVVLAPSPLWCGGGVVWFVGYVWCVWSVWYGMFGKYGMYGRYGMYGMNGWYCMDGRYGM